MTSMKSIRHASGVLWMVCAIILALITFWPQKESLQELSLDDAHYFSQPSHELVQGQIKVTLPPSVWLSSTQPIKVLFLLTNVPEETQIEARLALPGVRVEPGGDIQTRIIAGQPATLNWQISILSAGTYSGTIWLHARISQNDQEQPSSKILLAAIPIQIKGKAIFGLSEQETRFTIGVCLLVGVALLSDMIWKEIQKLGNYYHKSD